MTRARFDSKRGLTREAAITSLDRLPYWPEVILVATQEEAEALAGAFRTRASVLTPMPILVVTTASGIEPGRASMFRTVYDAASAVPLADAERLIEAVRSAQRSAAIRVIERRAQA